MKGKIKIRVIGKHISITGYTKNATRRDYLAVIDALMDSFGITVDERKEFCDILMKVAQVRADKSEECTETKEA